jgi:hypothetical protein
LLRPVLLHLLLLQLLLLSKHLQIALLPCSVFGLTLLRCNWLLRLPCMLPSGLWGAARAPSLLAIVPRLSHTAAVAQADALHAAHD